MKTFKCLILLSFVVLSSRVWSKEESIFFKDNAGDNYIISYEEEDLWMLDHIVVPKGKLQERVLHKTFKSLDELKKFRSSKFRSKTKNKSLQVKSKYVQTEKPMVIWEVQNQWDEIWEVKFSDWVKDEFNKDFFKKYNLKTDCADVAFALRWIYSRMHGLPAANTLAGSLTIFSQDSFKSEWSQLKTSPNWYDDELFLAALNYLLEHAYTKTLNIDGYPISISKDTFLVGTIHLDGGHTMIISKIDDQNIESAPIWKLSSTVPAAVRELHEEMMIDQTITDQSSGGLIRMRWPRKTGSSWDLVPKEEMPFYSLEQYEDSFRTEKDHFTLSLIKKIGINFDPEKILVESATSLINDLNYRKIIVEEGYNACLVADCSEGTFEYEEYSTPTRDGRILTKYKTIENLVNTFSEIDSTLRSKWKNLSQNSLIEVLGIKKSLEEYRNILGNYFLSSHPEDSIAIRWGLTPSDIAMGLEANLSRKLNQRAKLIQDATICVGTKLCEKGSDNWKSLNTFEFDKNLTERIYGSYFTLCAQNDCDQLFKTSFGSLVENIPFLASNPNLPKAIREGDQKKNFDSYPLPNASKIIQLGSDLFLLDNKIYNSYSRNFDKNWKDILHSQFNPISKVLVGLKDKKVVFKRLSDPEYSELKTSYAVDEVKWLSHDYLLAKDCIQTPSTECHFTLFIFDAKNGFVPIKDMSSIFNITLKEDYDYYSNTDAASFSYMQYNNQLNSYDTIEIVLTESQIYEDRLISVNIRDTSYFKDYTLVQVMPSGSSDQASYLYNLKNGQKCSFPYYLNSYVGSLESSELSNYYIASLDNDKYVYGEILDNCQVKEYYTADSFVYTEVKNGDFFIHIDQDKYGVVENSQLKVLTSKGTGYFPSYYSNQEVLWMKMTSDYTKIIDVYRENIQSGDLTSVNPKSIKLPCTDTRCVTSTKEIYGELYYQRDDVYSYSYSTIYLDNMILGTTFSKTANQPEIDMKYIKQTLYIEKGVLVEVAKGSYLYIK